MIKLEDSLVRGLTNPTGTQSPNMSLEIDLW